MDKDDMKTIGVMTTIALLIVVAVLGLVLQPLFEARAFNKFTTGPKATYWDACWTELRVVPQ